MENGSLGVALMTAVGTSNQARCEQKSELATTLDLNPVILVKDHRIGRVLPIDQIMITREAD
jgi:hypothetical protein